jgi:hypothetical protein
MAIEVGLLTDRSSIEVLLTGNGGMKVKSLLVGLLPLVPKSVKRKTGSNDSSIDDT